MVAKVLDGKKIQSELLDELKAKVDLLKAQGINPGIGTIIVGDDPASHYYIKSLKHSIGKKIGLTPIHEELSESASTQDVLEAINRFNDNPEVHAYIIQLPLPKHIDTQIVLSAIDPAKDGDGLHPENLGKLVLNEPAPLPCTPNGIIHLLKSYKINLDGANVVVVGRGITVGRTMGLLLTRKSENSTVTLCHTGTKNLEQHTKNADIIISAAGVPNIIKAEMIKPDSVLVDVGVSRVDGKIAGDLADDVWEKAGWVTPNPGGVGPLTVGFLLANVVEAASLVKK